MQASGKRKCFSPRESGKAARGDGTDGEGKKWVVEEGEEIPGHLSADAPRADLLFGVTPCSSGFGRVFSRLRFWAAPASWEWRIMFRS